MFISDLLFGCKNSKLCSIILIDAVKKPFLRVQKETRNLDEGFRN